MEKGRKSVMTDGGDGIQIKPGQRHLKIVPSLDDVVVIKNGLLTL